MADHAQQLPLRSRPWGVRRGDVQALQQSYEHHAATQAQQLAAREAENTSLTTHNAALTTENANLTADLHSAHLALAETTGWSQRLPRALTELGSLAAGIALDDQSSSRLAAAILALGGEHLVAAVEVAFGDPTGDLAHTTTRNDNGRPVRTVVQLGECVVDCTWQPGVDAGEDTTRIVEGLCIAVVCSLAGLAASRVSRHLVTQLGEDRAYRRHLALRARLDTPTATIDVLVDPHSQLAHSELYGRKAWEAALARAAAELDRIARLHGGQAYHLSDLAFALLVDEDRVDTVVIAAEEELADYDGLIFAVGDAVGDA
jgi:hypothetical protein